MLQRTSKSFTWIIPPRSSHSPGHCWFLLGVNWCDGADRVDFLVCFLSWPFNTAAKVLRAIIGPRYDGKYLHELIRRNLGETRLHQTLTNVVIPTFDIKRLQPTIFSSYKVRNPFFGERMHSQLHMYVYLMFSAGKEQPITWCPAFRYLHRHLCSSNLPSSIRLPNWRLPRQYKRV